MLTSLDKLSRRRRVLRQKLVQDRPMTSLLDCEIALASDDILYERSDWVSMEVDHGHRITSDCGKMYALRAINRDGNFLWYVFREGNPHGYHSLADDPFDAFDEAVQTMARRREVYSDWNAVVEFAAQLRRGEYKFDLTEEHAYGSALCREGVSQFLRQTGLANRRRLSARIAAWLMLVEPQIGFVLHELMRREHLV